MSKPALSSLLTPDEAAERLRLKRRTVILWLEKGKLPGLKVGGHWRIPEAGLNAYLYQRDQLQMREGLEILKEAKALHDEWWELTRKASHIQDRLMEIRNEIQYDPDPSRFPTIHFSFGDSQHPMSLLEWLRSTIPVRKRESQEEAKQREAHSYWTVEQVAQQCGVTERTVRQWIADEKIIAYKRGRNWKIPEDEIARLLKAS